MQHPSTCSCSRRSFLRGSGLTLTGFGIASVFPTPWIEHVLAGSQGNDKRLMFIFLRGGNDGVNAVIPQGDPDYNQTNRPSLWIDPLDSIDLNGFAHLHPSLGNMMDGFNGGELAVVHRVGYANNSRSHFDGQRIWENGDPTQAQLFDGWLARYIAESSLSAGVELPALTVQGTPPLLLRGEEKFVNIANPDNFDYITSGDERTKYATGWRDMFANLVGLEQYRPVLSQTGVKLVDTLDEYATWDQENWDPKDPDNPTWSLFPVSEATNQAGFPPESFGFFRSLKVCALSLLESDPMSNNNGTRIAGTQLEGWDTHNGQGTLVGTQPTLFSWLAHGYRALRIVLSGAAIDPRGYPNIWNKTLVATMSEFGRTTKENGSSGTDHAAASCLFLQGGCVAGGVYNCDPSTWDINEHPLFGVNNRYLLERTDYRAIFWEILRDHMGAAPATLETIFPGYGALGLGAQELGFLSPCPTPGGREEPIPHEST